MAARKTVKKKGTRRKSSSVKKKSTRSKRSSKTASTRFTPTVRVQRSSSRKGLVASNQKSGWRAKPLSSGFLFTAIVGFLVSGYLVYPYSQSFGFAFMLVFTIMFMASLVSMTIAPVPRNEEL